MAKKMLKKQRIAIQKLEERVLFDAAGAVEIVDAAAAAAAVENADAVEAESSESAEDESAVMTAPPEDAAKSQEDADKAAAETGAEAAENADSSDEGFEQGFEDNTALAEELAEAVEDIEVEELDDIMPEDAEGEEEVAAQLDDEPAADAETEADSGNAVVFADAFEAQEEAAEERELVIISDYIKDKQEIISQLDENTDVLILEADGNPLDQINEYLDSRDNVKYDAIHVVSHGNAGYFLLNDSIVDAQAVAQDPASWKAIGEHLADDGDIMIYGCNVAGSSDGQAMIANIAELTGADVAASVDKVGSANGWELEYSYGIVDTQNIVINGMDYSLGSYTVYVFNQGQDTTFWDTHVIANGTESLGEDVTAAVGQLLSFTTTDGVNTYTVVENSGNWEWCMTQAGNTAGDDTIVISGGLAGETFTINAGHMTAVNQGLTVTAAGSTITVSTGGNGVTGELNISGAGAVNVTDDLQITTNGSFTATATGDIVFGVENGNLGGVSVAAGSFSVNSSGGNVKFYGNLDSRSLYSGAGTQIVINANSVSFANDVQVNGTVDINGDSESTTNQVAFGGAVSVDASGSLDVSGYNITFAVDGDAAFDVNGSVNINAAGNLTINPAFDFDGNSASSLNAGNQLAFNGAVNTNGNLALDYNVLVMGENASLTVEGGTLSLGAGATFNAPVTINEGANLSLADGITVTFAENVEDNNPNLNLMGTIAGGSGTTLVFADTLEAVDLAGTGTVQLESGTARYEFGLTSDTIATKVYRGHYGTLETQLAENVTLNESFFSNLVRTIGTFRVRGAAVTVTMAGGFAGVATLVDYTNDSTVAFDYSEAGIQYILGGSYYTLRVGGSNYKALLDDITVGVDEAHNSTTLTGTTAFSGQMSLGTTLYTQGHSVGFYGNTQNNNTEGRIEASAGTVTYAVTDDHEDPVFYAGNYANVGIYSAPVASTAGNVTDLTFTINNDFSVSGSFNVVARDMEDRQTENPFGGGMIDVYVRPYNFTVDVNGTVGSVRRIQLEDAALEFNGNVLGNITGGINAERSENYEGTLTPTLTFTGNADGQPLGDIGGITLNGVNAVFDRNTGNLENVSISGATATFNGSVAGIGNLELEVATVPNGNTLVDTPSTVTFNDSVTITGRISTVGGTVTTTSTFNFNGSTSGDAEIQSDRSVVNYNYDGDQTIYSGKYHDLNISGTGIKTIASAGTDIDGVGGGENLTLVGGVFNGNTSSITIASGTFSFSNLAAGTENAPAFTVDNGATLHFADPNTGAMTFNGSIDTSGTVEFSGRISTTGTLTVRNTGTLRVDDAAIGSSFDTIINEGEITFDKQLTVDLIHNYGTLTVTNNQVQFDIYNHSSGNIIFNITSGNGNSFTFAGGEAAINAANNTNDLVNGGIITVSAGHLYLDGFTQGDKDRVTGNFSDGSQSYVIAAGAALTIGVNAAFNDGNNGVSVSGGELLGSINNSGRLNINRAVTFNGSVVNSVTGTIELADVSVTFRNSFSHQGKINTADGNTNAGLVFLGGVSGSGTISSGNVGYAGTVAYTGSQTQQIFAGTYQNNVNLLGSGAKYIDGNVVFNAAVTIAGNTDVTTHNGGNVTFAGSTEGTGEFTANGSNRVNAVYENAAQTIFAGSYGDLEIKSTTARTIAAAVSVNNLTLSGNNTFAAGDNVDINVAQTITFAADSVTVFDRDLTGNAVLTGGGDGADDDNNNGSVTFAAGVSGTVHNLVADVTYSGNGENAQNILAGTYRNLTFNGTAKNITGDTYVSSSLTATDADEITVNNGSLLQVIGSSDINDVYVTGNSTLDLRGNIAVDNLTVDNGSLVEIHYGAGTGHRLGNQIAGSGRVTLGGTLEIYKMSEAGAADSITIYGWADVDDPVTGIATGTINIDGANVVFAEGADYGNIEANLMSLNMTGFAITDDGNRLLNQWITIDGAVAINQDTNSLVQNYGENSKFLLVNDVTLTINGFQNGIDGVAAIWVRGNSQLRIAHDATVGDLTVDEGSEVVFEENVNTFTLTIDGIANLSDGERTGAETIPTYGISGAGNVIFSGVGTGEGEAHIAAVNQGSGTLNMTGGTVTYAAGLAVYGGIYQALTLRGNTVANAVTVNGATTIDGASSFTGSAALNGTVTATGQNLTFSGAVSGTGTVNGGNVTYNSNSNEQTVLGGAYESLTLANGNGTAENSKTYNLNTDLSVTGTATIEEHALLYIYGGTQDDSVSVTFANTAGRDIDGDEGDAMAFGRINATVYSEVNYTANNSTVFGGTYDDIDFAGNTVESPNVYTAGGIITVNGNAHLAEGARFEAAGAAGNEISISFNGTTGDPDDPDDPDAASGEVNFGNYTNVYYSETANVIAGTYAGLALDGNHTVTGNITVSGIARFTGGTVSGAGNWTFSGSKDAGSTSVLENTGRVIYSNNFTGSGFSGSYNDLEVNSTSGITFGSSVSISHELSGTGSVTFTSQIAGTGIVAGDDAGNGTLSVTYDWNTDVAGTILAGTYLNLTLVGDQSGFVSGSGRGYNYRYSNAGTYKLSAGTTTVTGDFALQKYAQLTYDNGTAAATLVLKGRTNAVFSEAAMPAAPEGQQPPNAAPYFQPYNPYVGTMNMGSGSTVEYDANAAVFAGTYGNLTLNGAHDLGVYDITVNGTADFDGEVSGSGKWTFNGTATGGGSLNNAPGNDWYYSFPPERTDPETGIAFPRTTIREMYSNAGIAVNRVVYGSNFNGNIFAGTYTDLQVDAAGTNEAVAGVITLNGVLSGSGNLTFTGANTYGENARASHTGKVTYDPGSNVLGGSYKDIVLNGTRNIEEDITVSGKATLNGIQTLADGVTVNFAGTTNAGELISTAGNNRISYSYSGSGATVIYGADADVFQGEYYNLTLANGSIGNNQLGYGVEVDAEGNEILNGAVYDTGHITVRGEFNFSTHSVLAGRYSFTMEGTFGGNVDGIRQTAGTLTYGAGTLTYGAGADVLGGVYYNFTLTGGKDADNKLTYNALGDVTVNGYSNIGDYAIFAATGSSEITVNGTEFELESGRGYDRVWSDGNGNYVLYKNGRWELYHGDPSYVEEPFNYTENSNIDPFGAGAEWHNGSIVTGNMITITFAGTTNANDVGEVVQMGDYSATVYADSADMYKGSYFRFQVEAGDADKLYSDLPEDVVVTDELIVDVSDGYYFVFDQAVAEDFDLSITIHGDIWYTNAYLGGDNANSGHQPLAGSFAGSVRLGGDYMADHSYSGIYEGDVVLSGVTITGDDEYIDAKALRGTLTVENSNYSGANFRLLVSENVDERPGIEYKGDSTIMALYSSTDAVEGIAYKELYLDGNMNVAAGNTIEVADSLFFRENATLTVYGNFILGSKTAAGRLTAGYTNLLIANGTSEESVDLYLGDDTVLPVLYNAGRGSVNITAGNNITISSYGNASSGVSIENYGTINISVGDNLLINGVVIDGGNLNITAGNNAVLAGTALVTDDTGNTVITLGADAKIKSDILVYGSLAMTVVQGQFSGSGILVTGNGNFDLTLGTADSRPSTIANEILIDGGNASMTISGYHQTYSGMVRVHGGTLTITGSDIGFIDDVLNYDVGSIGTGTTSGTGYKWIHDYLANDVQYYSYYQGAKAVPGAANNPGRIVIDSGAGKVSFSALVVSGGEFDINSGIVTFNSDFAVSDGTFSITGGEVMFKSDVYVSAVYTGRTAGTHFTVSGGKVTMAGSLYNWVRIPVYYFGTDEKVPQFNGPFWKDASSKIHLDGSTGNSHIEFKGDASVTINRNMSNIGIWGDVSISIMENANVTVKGNFANFGEALSAFWGSGNNAKYDYVTQLMGFSSGFTAGGTTHPLMPDYLPGSSITEFILADNGKLNVIGETLNGAIYHNGTAWGKNTSGGLGYATFTINSNGNNFTGLFTNSSHFDINGSGNTFGDVQSRYFMTVTATNSFGTITNYHDLQIMNPKAVVLSLVNNGGNVWISGEADGFAFKNELTVNGGYVSIESEFGVDIASDVTVKNGGDLIFAAANVISGEVNVDDGTLSFGDEAGGFVLKSTVTVGKNGNLNISTDENGSVRFEDTVSNAGNFLVDGSVEVVKTVENSGKLTVSKQSVFSGTLNNTGEVLIASSAVGTTFSNIYNSGKFTNSSTGISQITDKNYRFENQAGGSFINNTGAEATFEAFTNFGMMKIDGTLTVNGNFINDGSGKDNGVYIYGIADFNRTGGETYNSGTIYLEPITGDHAVTVKFGTITNDGTITSLNDTRGAGDIYFKGKTEGSGSIDGFTGTIYYVYTGTEGINQTFYRNGENNGGYANVTVYVGNKSANPELDYSNGRVTLTENIAFKELILDGGNLAIGDGENAIILDASVFTEKTAGTVTVNDQAMLKFSNDGITVFDSNITNNGTVESAGDLVLNGATDGTGELVLAEGRTITYSAVDAEQVLFGFAENSASSSIVVSGADKAIASKTGFANLTNNGVANITVRKGAELTLGVVDGTASGVDGFTITTEAGDETADGGILNFNAGTLNAAIINAGIFNAAAAAGAVTSIAGTVTNSGVMNAEGVAGESNLIFNKRVDNSGSVSASGVKFNGGLWNTGSVTADNTSFYWLRNEGTGSIANIGEAVTWNGMRNAGTVNLTADMTIGSINSVAANTGTFNVAEGVTLTLDKAVAGFETGIIKVDNGAVLAVTAAGTADGETWEVTDGVKLNVVINKGTVSTAEGAVLDIASLDNGGADSNATLLAGSDSAIVVRASQYYNENGELTDYTGENGELILNGNVVRELSGKIYFAGLIDFMSVNISNDGSLSEATVSGNYNEIGFNVTGEGVTFTIDVDSGEGYSYNVTGGAELVIDSKDDTEITVDSDISVDADSSLKVVEDQTAALDGETVVDDEFVNDGNVTVGGELTAKDITGNGTIGASEGGSITAENISQTVENGQGTITVSGEITEVGSNAGTIDAANIGTVDENNGNIEGVNIGTVGSNAADGTITVEGNVGEVGTNSGDITAGGNVGDVNSNSGDIEAAGVGNVGSNAADGTITVEGNAGNVSENAGAITAGGNVGDVNSNSGDIEAAGVGNVGTNSGSVAANTIGNVENNTYNGVITQSGDNGSIGNIGSNAGAVTVNGNNTVAGDIEDNSGSIKFNGQNTQAGDINNGKTGSITVNGSVSAGDVSNAGDFVVSANGSFSADSMDNSGFAVNNTDDFSVSSMNNSGDFIDNGSSSIGSMNNSGDVTVKGYGSDYGSVDNSGSMIVSGSGNDFSSVTNSGSISLGGSGNSVGALGNSGEFEYGGSNMIGSIDNSGTGSIYRDGVIWMMATDEGMTPEFYSDGNNKNFSVLSHLTDMLDADTLEAGFVSTFDRLMPGRYTGDSHVRHADLHAALGRNTDLLNIDDAVDELIHGSAPELDEEELLDIFSGSTGSQDEFDAAVSEVIEE